MEMDKPARKQSARNSCSKEEFAKSVEESSDLGHERVKLILRSPRMFRKSLFYKTSKLFGSRSEGKPKVQRKFKEK